MRVAAVNADPGISPSRSKGAAVHLLEVRRALRLAGAEVVELDEPDSATLGARLAELHATKPLDLIYERYGLGAYVGSLFAQEHGIPHVLEVNAPLSEEARRYRPAQAVDIDHEAERGVFSGAARVFAVSTAVARFCIERGARPGRVECAANAVDPDRFQPMEAAARSRLREDLGIIHPDAILVGFHGRVRPWHNLEALGRSVADTRQEGARVHLLTVGEGDFETELIQHLGPAGIGTPWLHRPWADREEIARLVACFDLLALSYAPDEDFYFSPLKLLEAMAAGVPVVVPRLGDLPDWVKDGVEGVLVEPGDRNALTAALVDLAADAGRRTRMGHAARARASAHSWESFARRVLRVAGSGDRP